MKTSNSKRWLPFAAAAIITVAVRLTVFGDDCNLFVVGMTFVLAYLVCYGILRLITRFDWIR